MLSPESSSKESSMHVVDNRKTTSQYIIETLTSFEYVEVEEAFIHNCNTSVFFWPFCSEKQEGETLNSQRSPVL